MIADLTDEELVAVARFWFRRLDQIDRDAFQGGPLEDAGPSDIADVHGRVKHIAELVGDDAVRQARKDVREENYSWDGREFWDAMNSDEEDLRAILRQHYSDERNYIRHKEQDKETQQQVFEYLLEHPSGYQLDDSGDLWYFRRSRVDTRQLMLTVRTFGGSQTSFPKYSTSAPWGWVPPFGLHN